jgi:hypothetical protein
MMQSIFSNASSRVVAKHIGLSATRQETLSWLALLSISMPTAAAKRSGPSLLKQGVCLPAIVWCAVASRSACHFTRKVRPGTNARDCLKDIRLGLADDPFDAHQWPQARQRIAILSTVMDDLQLRRNILDELDYEPSVDAAIR